jgi:hypothetical protein
MDKRKEMEDDVIHLGIGRGCDENEMLSERQAFQERSGRDLLVAGTAAERS